MWGQKYAAFSTFMNLQLNRTKMQGGATILISGKIDLILNQSEELGKGTIHSSKEKFPKRTSQFLTLVNKKGTLPSSQKDYYCNLITY